MTKPCNESDTAPLDDLKAKSGNHKNIKKSRGIIDISSGKIKGQAKIREGVVNAKS